MARQKLVDTKIQVTRGFVTEYTPVGFPQEAAIDIDNCVIDVDGSVRRRPGLDLEASFVLNNVNGAIVGKGDLQSQAFSTFLWEGVANSGTLNIVVVQLGLILQFYAQIGAVSSNLLGELDLSAHASPLDGAAAIAFEFAGGLGSLYVVSKQLAILQITYDGTSFTVKEILLEERDFNGLDDGLANDERPTILDRNHYYNLLNQGWTDDNLKTFGGVSAGTDLCSATGGSGLAGSPDWPSNSDIMSVGIVVNSSADLEFDATYVRESYLGNTPAPRGHFVVTSFFKDYDAVSGCSGMGSEITTARPEAVAFHQGRVFFTSPVVQNRVNGIFYSQNLININKVGFCYQEADPTATEINDLIATDGGFLPTPGIGQIIKMTEFSNGVVIFATNGVWYLTGAELGSPVTATSIRLDKVHGSGCLSAASVVDAESQLFYWGNEGVMSIGVDEAGTVKASSVTQTSIQQFYVNISATARKNTTGIYLPEQRKIYWAYRDTGVNDTSEEVNYNKMLVLDLDVKGWYKYSIAEDADNNFPEVMGLAKVAAIAAGVTTTENVTDSMLVDVTDSLGAIVTVAVEADGAQVSTLKLATMVYSTLDTGYKLSFSSFTDKAFVDWRFSSDDGLGLPMQSFVEFAEFNMGAVHTKGKPTYVHSYFARTSKNLNPGGYYELPPLFFNSTGLRVTQSLIEVLYNEASDLRVTQSVIEVLYSAA